MRIGIDYRFLSAGVSTVNRGMGRYTQQQIREVLARDEQNEYVLFCPPGFDPDLILPEIRRAPNVSTAIVQRSAQWVRSDPNDPDQVLRFAEEYQAWVYQQQVDLYHATTPFLFNDTIAAGFDACPMVATFYDAIPLIYRERYFPRHAPITDLYLRATEFIRSAARLVAISQSAQRDAVCYAGIPEAHIDIAYPIADPWFRPLAADQIERDLQPLRQRLRLPPAFVMAVPHLHYSKNFETLLDSYALLPRAARQTLPLVVTCHFRDDEKITVRHMLERRGLTDEVLITGFVTETELVALYNQALVFLHASRYEGFGLPVLEAMCCGTPVIASNTSSLPEVGGEAALWVDPNDPHSIAEALLTLCNDPERRAAMRAGGLRQVGRFTPAQLGQQTLACYQRAMEPLPPEQVARPHLALWTPLPPLRSGVADYSLELLEHLTTLYKVEVFVDDGYLPELRALQWCRVHHHSAFARRHAQRPFEMTVYQVGASMFHAYMYDALQRYPGIVVLHDLVWGYVLYEWFTSRGQSEEFRTELATLEGPTALEEFDRALRRLPTQRDALFEFLDRHYMLARLVTGSRAIVVHMEAVAHELKERYPTAMIDSIRMGVADPWRGWPTLSVADIRAELGLASNAFVIGVFGIVHPVKRLEALFAAFQALAAQFPHARLVIVGDTHEAHYKTQLADYAERLQLGDRVVGTGHVPPLVLERWLTACDVVINLRYPSRKQMSGILLRAIAAGKPVLLSDLPEWRFIPSDFIGRVPTDASEVSVLTRFLEQLASQPALRQRMGREARAYFLREANVLSMTADYQRVIERLLTPSLPAPRPSAMLSTLNKVCEVEDWATPDLRGVMPAMFASEWPACDNEALSILNRRHWAGAMAVAALAHGAALHAASSVLVVGEAVRPLLNYLEPRIAHAAQASCLNFPDASFDGVCVEGLTLRPGGKEAMAHMAYEAGRIVRLGGVVSITLNYLLSGPPGGGGWDAEQPLLAWPEIQRYIIEASGLELQNPVQIVPSPATLAQSRARAVEAREADSPLFAAHILRTVEGYVFCPLHLALFKSESYPRTLNSWAKPAGSGWAARPRPSAGLPAAQPGMDLTTWSQLNQPNASSAVNSTANRRSLNLIRRILSEDRLVRIRWRYGQALRRLPRRLAQRIHHWAFRLGLVETKDL